MERLTQGGMKADCAPTKASQVVIDKVDHLIVRAEHLNAAAGGLSSFLLGARPAVPESEKPTPDLSSFINGLMTRLDALGRVLGEAQEHLDEIRSQF